MKKNHSNVLGIEVFNGSYNEAIEESLNTKGYSCFVNSHMLYEHERNVAFKEILKKSSFNFADGMPLVHACRLFWKKKQDRIAGNDIIYSLIRLAKERRLKIFLIGGSQKVLDIISSKLDIKCIKHQTYSPPFLPIEKFDFDFQVELINNYQPDLVLVGLGCPKQEIWMSNVSERIEAPLYGVGGAFLLYSGIDSRAPKWMRDIGAEWVFRLSLEPRRLFRRYLISNTYFCGLFLKEFVRNRKK